MSEFSISLGLMASFACFPFHLREMLGNSGFWHSEILQISDDSEHDQELGTSFANAPESSFIVVPPDKAYSIYPTPLPEFLDAPSFQIDNNQH